MEKSNKIYLIIILLCAVLVTSLCVFAILTHKEVELTDGEKFKNEYESLNEIKDEDDKNVCVNMSIDSDNVFVYKTGKQIVELIKNGEGVIYFGFSACPWCRNVVPYLNEVAKEEGLDKIYYLDISNIRDDYKYSGSIEPTKTKNGTAAYYDILEILDEYLEKYYVKDEAGNMYGTGVKRLYAPTVISFKKGEVLSFHQGSVESQIDPTKKLTKDELTQLKDTYKKLIKSLDEEKKECSDKKSC